MQVLTTLEELDAKLAECAAAQRVSDDELRRVFASFRMEIPADVPADPFSPEYREHVMAMHRRVAGRTYRPENEITTFDVEAAERRPFPYYTGNPQTAGFFTMGAGFLLHTLQLAPGARVLEFGPGWGNTTLALAMLGFDVTAVDIEPNFCDLLERRARRQGVGLTVVNADFLWAETVEEPYDAVVFFECFHHCSDHQRLLAALDRAVKPGGRVYFGAEPIVPDFPIPWGLRMDGESLWAIRSNGWMELGFSESYFREALRRAGWRATRHAYPEIGWAAVWEARRISELAPEEQAAAPAPAAGPPPPPRSDLRATEADILACFRLLLGREPNAEERRGHLARVGEDLAGVVASYLNSFEFSRRGLLRGADAGVSVASLPGFSICIADDDAAVGRDVRADNYEREVAAVFRARLRPGMGVIDIGANIGYFTLLSASLVGTAGYVLAIEPNPRNVRLLEASRSLNRFAQVVVAQCAAGPGTGVLALHTSHSNGTTSTLPPELDRLLAAETVACIRPDALAPPERIIDLIKVDVEGAEYLALQGCQRVIERDHPAIISEFSPGMLPGLSGIDGPGYLRWLQSLDYELGVIAPDGTVQTQLSVERVMQTYQERGSDHIDLLAEPLRRLP